MPEQRSGKTSCEDGEVLYSGGLSVIPDFPHLLRPGSLLGTMVEVRDGEQFYCEILSEQHSEGWASIGPERHKQS